MIKSHQRKRIALLLFTTSIAIFSFILLVFGSQIYQRNKVLALIDGQKIYYDDVRNEISQIFLGSNPGDVMIEKLPKNVLLTVAKGVFIKNHLHKKALNLNLDKNEFIQNNIDNYSKTIIQEYYLDKVLNKRVDDSAILDKYAQIAHDAKSQREYLIGHILVNTQYQAKKVRSKSSSFKTLAQKYSQDQQTRYKSGKLGYFSDEDLREEFVDFISNAKEGQISDPIETKDGWHLVKLFEIKTPQIGEFEDMKSELIEILRQEEIDNLFAGIIDDVEVKLLIKDF